MKDFLFVFRAEPTSQEPSPEARKDLDKKWMDWIGDIAAQNRLKDVGNRLHKAGKVVKGQQVVTDGPYSEMKEVVGGYTMVRAASEEEAVKLAHGCPIFLVGGNVEVREINPM